MIYTGIGARATPPNILIGMTSVGRFMASGGHTLRSGGAAGADEAFEKGCVEKDGAMEIYLPWRSFRHNQSPLFGSCKESRQIAKDFHPNWPILGGPARDFMGRNTYQILGKDLKTPTGFVLCWTPDGKSVGGTSQAIRLAQAHDIPVLNLGCMSFDEVNKRVTELIP